MRVNILKMSIYVSCITVVYYSFVSSSLAEVEAYPKEFQKEGETREYDDLKRFSFIEINGEHPTGGRDVRARNAKSPLLWRCKILGDTFQLGDPVLVEVTVTNESSVDSVTISPPYRGWLSANLQVWIRPDGQTAYKALDGWIGNSGKSPKMNIPQVIKPGETRRWVSRIDHFSGARIIPSQALDTKLISEDFLWLGGVNMDTPGKYNIVLRYLNTAELAESVGNRPYYSEPSVRIFGPHSIKVKDVPDCPKFVNEARASWRRLRPKSDVIHLPSSSPYRNLSEQQLEHAGPVADDIRTFMLTLDWQRVHDSKEKYGKYIDRLNLIIRRLTCDNSHRAAAEFLRAAAIIESEDEITILKELQSSANPDVQILLQEWLSRKLKKESKQSNVK